MSSAGASKPLIVVVTDLDASLLNEDDYSWSDAASTLDLLAARKIPLVLASSKTAAEMQPLAEEMHLNGPLICENGGSIHWPDGTQTTTAVDREQLLQVLDRYRSTFRFQSFRDLGTHGIMQATGLSETQASRANLRASTEPLLWEDSVEKIPAFAESLRAADLTLTKGGRFWHVAGDIDKAAAMRQVVSWFRRESGSDIVTIAVGDSPNDIGMLQAADYAIVIPDQNSQAKIEFSHPHKSVALQAGSVGWSTAVRTLIETLGRTP